MSGNRKRFHIALSFPGEHRESPHGARSNLTPGFGVSDSKPKARGKPPAHPGRAGRGGCWVRPAWVWLAFWLLVAPVVVRADAGGDISYAGMALEEALLALTEQGLELVFTDRVVRPEMRVERQPTASGAPAILAQLLRPHGLTTRTGAGGVLFVVPAEAATSSVTGTVRQWRGGPRLRGVTVSIVESGQRTVTAADGGFRIVAVAGGRYFLQASRPGFMILQTEIQVPAGENVDFILELRPMPMTVERIDVNAKPPGLLGDEISSLHLDRDELHALPRLGEDLLRLMTLLPGTAGNELSARFHVRGGRSDEVMVRLDGFEILEPYHLLDFDGALGILAPGVIGEAELITGALPIRYGDRMSGVLDLTTREPPWEWRTEVGVSVFLAQAGRSGTLGNDRGHWLAALRIGSLEPAAKLVEEQAKPHFSDVFGKIARTPAPGRSLRGNLLVSWDQLDFVENLGEITSAEDGEQGEEDDNVGQVSFDTSYVNGYAWVAHQVMLAKGLYFESAASTSRIERRRQGEELDDSGTFELDDQRRLTTLAAGQDWTAQISSRHELNWGFDLRDLDADFDYSNERELTDPLAVIGHRPPEDDVRLDQRLRGRQYAAYLGSRWRPARPVTVHLGLRYDKNTILDDSDFSPRLSLAYRPRPRSRLRLAWGLFHQSQRLYELQVADGETRFFPSERSEHRIAGLEQVFARHGARAGRPLTLRVELYEYRLHDPRPRFTNLYDPISLAPEVEADRVRIVPGSGIARGLEIFIAGGGGRLDWFASYTHSRSRDLIDGRDVSRGIDQPHALKLGLGYRTPWKWDLYLALEAHTGWPTTRLAARRAEGEEVEAEIIPILGQLHGERLPAYYRLDLRAGRRFTLRRGELELFIEVHNLSNATNVRGFDVSFETLPEDRVEVIKDQKLWGGIAPNFGIRWLF